jgi:hypothetical protein
MRKDMQPKRKKVRTTFLIIVSLLASVVDLSAQSVDVGTPTADSDTLFRRCITVVDVETMIPIKGVSVRADRQSPRTTDYLGRVELTERFDSIRFSHVEYSAEQLSFIELRDTMYLFPKHNLLDEIVVTGIGADLRNAMKKNHEANLAQPTVKGLTFDFGLLLDKRGRRDRKHLMKAREILREWDMKPVYREKDKDKDKENNK